MCMVAMLWRMGPAQAADPNAMPLADDISETITLLEENPDAEEIFVQRVLSLRWAEREDRYADAFAHFNG
jgi:uncharacterized oxidoreductase